MNFLKNEFTMPSKIRTYLNIIMRMVIARKFKKTYFVSGRRTNAHFHELF